MQMKRNDPKNEAETRLAESERTLSEGAVSFPTLPGYTVLERLGAGGFGEVYRARDDKLQRDVAVKIELPSASVEQPSQERFLGEARALARVRHPNVLAIHSVTEYREGIALVTEFIDGKPLSEIVEDIGPFGAAEAGRIGIELCHALAAVHGAGLVHRDVKSPNVLREQGGRIVLADFGLGVIVAEGRGVTESALPVGSPLFMAPEQIRGDVPDARTDLYALGVLLYHVSTGKFPVKSFDLRDLLGRIEKGDLVPLSDARPDLPEPFVRVVAKAMAREPSERYQTAGEMEAALATAVGDVSAPVAATPNSRRVWMGLLAAVFILTAGLVAWKVMFPTAPGAIRVEEAQVFLELEHRDQALTEGAAVRVGDALFLQFRAREGLHVYVINEDEQGERYTLFPHRRGTLQNPLEAGVRHRLPGVVAGKDLSWQVSSAGGTETIVLIASRDPIDELERSARNDVPGAFYPQVTEEAIEGVLRGLGTLVERRATDKRRLGELVAEVTERRNGSAGLWVRRFTLESS